MILVKTPFIVSHSPTNRYKSAYRLVELDSNVFKIESRGNDGNWYDLHNHYTYRSRSTDINHGKAISPYVILEWLSGYYSIRQKKNGIVLQMRGFRVVKSGWLLNRKYILQYFYGYDAMGSENWIECANSRDTFVIEWDRIAEQDAIEMVIDAMNKERAAW